MNALDLPFFVVGALARDLLLTHVFGFQMQRLTRDLDIAFAVRDWSEFDAVVTKLVEDAKFVRDSKLVHRMQRDNHSLDIIPYGGVESAEHTIAWPPDREIVMNVAGFQDAFDAAVTVRIETALDIRVVSLPGLAALKLLAWSDARRADSRDALDLAQVLRCYADAGNNDRIYGAEFDAMEAADYSLELAGARLLGRDAGLVVSDAVRAQMLDLLENSKRRVRLATDMAPVWSRLEDTTSIAEAFLAQFHAGTPRSLIILNWSSLRSCSTSRGVPSVIGLQRIDNVRS